jgi:cellobiose phosphorylase
VYHFDHKNREIVIKKHDLPSPWINYLSNGRFHGFVSQAGGGFVWKDNPVMFRITRYRMYHLPIDSPGFYIYLRDKNGVVWSPTFRPVETALEKWNTIHRPGSTTFIAKKKGVEARLTLFISPETDVLIWDLNIANDTGIKEEYDVFAYAEFSQMSWKQENFDGYYWRHMLKAWYDEELCAVKYLFHSSAHPEKDDIPLVYFASSVKPDSHSCDRDLFTGSYRSEKNPICVENGICSNEDLAHGEPCGALHHHIVLDDTSTRITYFLGVEGRPFMDFDEAETLIAATLHKLRNEGEVESLFVKLNQEWNEHLDSFHCTISDKGLENQINTWSPVNSVNTFRYSRSVNTNAAGLRGLGFRDTCQDLLAYAYRKPVEAEERLLLLLSKQYPDGHVVHQIPYQKNELPECKTCCDNHLWLPFAAYAIATETGNKQMFQKSVPFLSLNHIDEEGSGSIWDHLMSGIRFTEEHLGIHQFPLTLKGDWNDIIHKFNQNGESESVFAAQQYIVALKIMILLSEWLGKKSDTFYLQSCLKKQTHAIEDFAWDTDRWIRCTDDAGGKIGSQQSKYGKLWLNPQSWAVISGTGSLEQRKLGMQQVYEHLNTGYGIRLLAPGFETWPQVSDPFTGYNPGCGENGAVFCHSNAWAIIAETLLGNGGRAWEYFSQIAPDNALKKLGLDRYKAEPYAWASNIVGTESPKYGWANITHITGTASWMDIAATQYLLGIVPRLEGIEVNPCIPCSWDGFSVSRIYRGCRINITVTNPNHVEKGVNSINVEGIEIDQDNIPFISMKLLKGKKYAKVKVVMG